MSYECSFDKEIDNPKLLDTLKAEFFTSSVVRAELSLEGQRIKDNAIVIGCRAGPSLIVTALIHEMCHLVEIDRPRMNQFGWGLSHGKYWEIGSHSGYEFHTNQSVLRECRVWAFAKNVQDAFGIQEDLEEVVSSATYLGAFHFMPGKGDKEKLKSVANEVKKGLPKYTFELFKKEWRERMEYLERESEKSAK